MIAVDGAIHRAAGPRLLRENRDHQGCQDGEAVESGGYELPAKCNTLSYNSHHVPSINRRHLHRRSERRTPRSPPESLQKLSEEDVGVETENNCNLH